LRDQKIFGRKFAGRSNLLSKSTSTEEIASSQVRLLAMTGVMKITLSHLLQMTRCVTSERKVRSTVEILETTLKRGDCFVAGSAPRNDNRREATASSLRSS
jgi:hypothetical protein